MRTDLLGLPLHDALTALGSEDVEIVYTCAPRRAGETGGTPRVVAASDDGRRLTVARFLDPISA